jgi:hypothetical protein
MIVTGTSHDLSGALAIHLLRADHNESVRILPGRDVPDTAALPDAIQRIRDLAIPSSGKIPKKPGYHLSASPSQPLDADGWTEFWTEIEREMGLSDCAYVEVEHVKQRADGTSEPHRHRVYSRVDLEGNLANNNRDWARLATVARLHEYRHGEEMTPTRFDPEIINRLRRSGHHDAAAVVEAASPAEKPVAAISGSDFKQQQSTKISARDVHKTAWMEWSESVDPDDFARRMRRRGLTVVQGDKGPTIIDPRGGTYGVGRSVASGCKLLSGQTIKSAPINKAVASIPLMPIDAVRNDLPVDFTPWRAAQPDALPDLPSLSSLGSINSSLPAKPALNPADLALEIDLARPALDPDPTPSITTALETLYEPHRPAPAADRDPRPDRGLDGPLGSASGRDEGRPDPGTPRPDRPSPDQRQRAPERRREADQPTAWLTGFDAPTVAFKWDLISKKWRDLIEPQVDLRSVKYVDRVAGRIDFRDGSTVNDLESRITTDQPGRAQIAAMLMLAAEKGWPGAVLDGSGWSPETATEAAQIATQLGLRLNPGEGLSDDARGALERAYAPSETQSVPETGNSPGFTP